MRFAKHLRYSRIFQNKTTECQVLLCYYLIVVIQIIQYSCDHTIVQVWRGGNQG
jgi:hypothetical protein